MALGQKNYCLYLTWAASIGLNLSKTDENRRNQSRFFRFTENQSVTLKKSNFEKIRKWYNQKIMSDKPEIN
jgi:hypothetical protein